MRAEQYIIQAPSPTVGTVHTRTSFLFFLSLYFGFRKEAIPTPANPTQPHLMALRDVLLLLLFHNPQLKKVPPSSSPSPKERGRFWHSRREAGCEQGGQFGLFGVVGYIVMGRRKQHCPKKANEEEGGHGRRVDADEDGAGGGDLQEEKEADEDFAVGTILA